MRCSLFSVTLGTLLLLSAVGASGQTGGGLPAPLPVAVTSAKTMFIYNNGSSSIAYEAFCDGIRNWGKYEIVTSPDEADLNVELRYRDADKSTAFWSGTTFAAMQPKREKTVAQIIVTIYDSKTNQPLWSGSDSQKRAKREKNRDREAVQSIQHLVNDLEMRAVTSE